MNSVELALVQGALDILGSAKPDPDSLEEQCIESAEELLRNAIAERKRDE